jgi:hypothetical protein
VAAPIAPSVHPHRFYQREIRSEDLVRSGSPQRPYRGVCVSYMRELRYGWRMIDGGRFRPKLPPLRQAMGRMCHDTVNRRLTVREGRLSTAITRSFLIQHRRVRLRKRRRNGGMQEAPTRKVIPDVAQRLDPILFAADTKFHGRAASLREATSSRAGESIRRFNIHRQIQPRRQVSAV